MPGNSVTFLQDLAYVHHQGIVFASPLVRLAWYTKTMQVIVVGGGVMGCACALELAARKVRVMLLERAIPGAEASSAAAGMLGAQTDAREGGVLLQDLLQARESYSSWAEELRALTGIDIGYRAQGILRVTRNATEHEELVRTLAWQRTQGQDVELLDSIQARRIEPSLTQDLVSAAYFAQDGQVDPPQLLRALVAGIDRLGVVVHTGLAVERILVEQGRCVGVQMQHSPLHADAVVLAAGSWSSLVSGLPETLPHVQPARGQMIEVDQRPPSLRTIVVGHQTYAVPRGDGRVVCGSTLEFVGFRHEVTAGGVASILHHVLDLVPELAHAQYTRAWNNFRPHCDKLLVGPSEIPGLLLATGHHRSGILLAKWTAERIADSLTGKR